MLYNHRPKDTSVSSTYYSTQTMANERYKDEEWLEEQFVEKGRTHTDIASDCSCSGVTVGNWINKYGIERPEPKYEDDEWLIEQYVSNDRSGMDISRELDCSGDTVQKRVRELGIGEEKPWRDEDTLRKLYCEEEMTATDVGKELGCEQKTVLVWLEKNDIERRSFGDYLDSPWDDEDVLKEMYVEEGLTIREISDHFDCAESTIYIALEKYSFDTDLFSFNLHVSPSGYEHVNGAGGKALIHRLVAVSEYGFDEVSDMEVHHKNEIPWDNRVENLQLMLAGEHSSYHRNKEYSEGKELFGGVHK